MAILYNPFRTRDNENRRDLQEGGSRKYHTYGKEILADAFLSPIQLPNERLRILKGSDSLMEMSAKARISDQELGILLDNINLEPTTGQLLSLSVAYDVSVLWLLGYHTLRQSHPGGGDREILSAIAERNVIERGIRADRGKGLFAELLREKTEQRLLNANLRVASTAARIVAKEHLALSGEELRLLLGQPVFVERFRTNDGEWGLVEEDRIHTVRGDLFLDAEGEEYQAFQMPRMSGTTET